MKKILLAMIHGLLPILGIILIVSIIVLAVYFTRYLGLGAYQDIAVVIVLIIVAWIISAVIWYKNN